MKVKPDIWSFTLLLSVSILSELHLRWDTYVKDVHPVFGERGVTLFAGTPVFQDALQQRPWAAPEEIFNVALN